MKHPSARIRRRRLRRRKTHRSGQRFLRNEKMRRLCTPRRKGGVPFRRKEQTAVRVGAQRRAVAPQRVRPAATVLAEKTAVETSARGTPTGQVLAGTRRVVARRRRKRARRSTRRRSFACALNSAAETQVSTRSIGRVAAEAPAAAIVADTRPFSTEYQSRGRFSLFFFALSTISPTRSSETTPAAVACLASSWLRGSLVFWQRRKHKDGGRTLLPEGGSRRGALPSGGRTFACPVDA